MSSTTNDARYMEFKLGQQQFAIPLLDVREVIRMPEITNVPNMPVHFEGMMNLRGQIFGVFNIRKKLNSKNVPKDAEQIEVVIVVEKNGVSVGIIVDEVSRVLHPSPNMMKPAPVKDDDPAKNYVGPVIQTDSGLVLVVNIEKLLELEKFQSMSAA